MKAQKIRRYILLAVVIAGAVITASLTLNLLWMVGIL
jgi:hypothetical protein